MVDTEKPEFLRLLHACGEYYGRDLSKEAVSIYWAGLADMSIAAVKSSLNAHVRDVQAGQFMPKIADMAESCRNSRLTTVIGSNPKIP